MKDRNSFQLALAMVSPPHKVQVCSLWEIQEPALLIDEQVASVSRKMFHQIQLICQLHPLLGKVDLGQ